MSRSEPCQLACSKFRCSLAALMISLMTVSSASAQDAASQPMPGSPAASSTSSPDNSGSTSTIYTLQPIPSGETPVGESLLDRQFLLGDAGGWREQLAANGYTFSFSSTQYYQGVSGGGLQQLFQYSGRDDLYVNVDGEKAGLWKGLFVNLHGENRYGDAINASQTGALIPPNMGALFPTATGTPVALTGVKVTQALSEQFVVFGGKLNMIDGLTQNYAAGRGVDAFMNLGLALPLVAARTIPYSTLGGGFAVLHNMEPVFTFMVIDTHNTPTTTGFESFFTNGATMLGMLKVPVNVMGLPGHQGIAGTYSTGTYNDLSPTAYFNPNVGLVVTTGTINGSWSFFYSADQALYVDPTNSKRSWGLFTNIGAADNGPSPIQCSANFGLGGSSPIVSRPLDTFGIGYSYTQYSAPVKELAPVLLPIGNDQAVELFYNIAVTPWFRLTPDVQFLVPARERTLPPAPQPIDTAVVIGMRAKIEF